MSLLVWVPSPPHPSCTHVLAEGGDSERQARLGHCAGESVRGRWPRTGSALLLQHLWATGSHRGISHTLAGKQPVFRLWGNQAQLQVQRSEAGTTSRLQNRELRAEKRQQQSKTNAQHCTWPRLHSVCICCMNGKEDSKQHWLVWLSGLSTGLQTKASLVRFPVGAHA